MPMTCNAGRGCALTLTGPDFNCRTHGCWDCGNIMLADTEDWHHHYCVECWEKAGEPTVEPPCPWEQIEGTPCTECWIDGNFHMGTGS
jgi:hypothetical protein